MAKERAQKWVAQLEDPDMVGQSEYLAIYELLSDVANGQDEEADLDHMDAVLEEVMDRARDLSQNLRRFRRDKKGGA